MVDFFLESDNKRSSYNGDWSRSSKRTELLHGFIENDLKNKNSTLKIEKEKEVQYNNNYSKRHDFLINDNKILELKFIEKVLKKMLITILKENLEEAWWPKITIKNFIQ